MNLGALGQTVLVIAALALGKPVLVPLALAFYFAFVLTPPSAALERLGFPRFLSVATVAGGAAIAFATLGSVLVSQVSDLSSQLPVYSGQITQKLSGLRTGHLGLVDSVSRALAQVSRALDPDSLQADRAAPVRLVPASMSAFARIEEAVGPLIDPIAKIGIVCVLTIFVLARREDLRGRVIQLVGAENVTLTTRTLDEAAQRIGHFLLTHAYVNLGFGVVMGIGLYSIGLPYAIVWGALAGLLRFVPLVGALIAVALPSLVAFASFPGWLQTILTVVLFVAGDLLVGNVVEPVVLGKRTGVASMALLVSALFWAWLWGPVGLLLATPLTVCAVVLGKHVPQLAPLAILLADEAGLQPDVNFYQRLLARAVADAHRLGRRSVGESSLAQTLDTVVLPALGLMTRDQNVGAIGADTAQRVVKDMGEVVARLARPAVGPSRPASVMGIPAESSVDVLLLRMLAALRAGELAVLKEAPRDALVAEVVARDPTLVVIAARPPNANANARYLCRRLRAALPQVKLVVLAPPGQEGRAREAAARLREAGADAVATSLREAVGLLDQAV